MGTLVGAHDESLGLIEKFELKVLHMQKRIDEWPIRPRVYFEEWDDPIISGIAWVSELVELAGGEDVFKTLSQHSLAKDRIVSDPKLVCKLDPDIIIASWCGKKFEKQKLIDRQGWKDINAVKRDKVFEIKSEIILQPGPACLFDGLELLHELFTKHK